MALSAAELVQNLKTTIIANSSEHLTRTMIVIAILMQASECELLACCSERTRLRLSIDNSAIEVVATTAEGQIRLTKTLALDGNWIDHLKEGDCRLVE